MFNHALLFVLTFFAFASLNGQSNWTNYSNETTFAFVAPTDITDLEVEEIIAEKPSVTLAKFEHEAMGKHVVLNWESESEAHNAHFLVQRSTDGGETYLTLAELKAANAPCEYIYIDDIELTNQTTYRLAQVNTDGAVYFFTEL